MEKVKEIFNKVKTLLFKYKYVSITGCALIVILVAYLVLCGVAGSNDFNPRTTINGIKVGSLSLEEAIDEIQAQYESDTKALVLTYSFGEEEFEVEVDDLISFDSESGVTEIYNHLNGNFFLRGYYYLFDNSYTVGVGIEDEETLSERIEETDLLDYDTKVETSYTFGEDCVVFTKGVSGEIVEIDNVLSDTLSALENYDFKDAIQVTTTTSNLDEDEMDTIYEEIYDNPTNATLKLDEDYNYEIVDDVSGAIYDLDDAKDAYDSAKEGAEFSVEAEIVSADVTADDLEENLFREVIGEYTTYVSGTSARRSNVQLAGSKCNVILNAGESFSFNDIVGERTAEAGFQEAAAYNEGETVQELGGGVCQVSSTLYNAVVLANLQVDERTNHTYISSYVPLGRDATVSWGGPDFVFTNDTDYPIKVVVTYNGYLTVQIYGTDLEDTEVEFTYEKLSTVKRSTEYEDDDTLEEGTEVTETSGSDGAKVQTYRTVYKNGELVSTEKEAYSYYKPHNKVVRRGTKVVEEEEEEESSDDSSEESESSDDDTTEDSD